MTKKKTTVKKRKPPTFKPPKTKPVEGKIEVLIKRSRRLEALANLSESILCCAKALSVPSCETQVNVTNCSFTSSDVGMNIAADTEVAELKRTKIWP